MEESGDSPTPSPSASHDDGTPGTVATGTGGGPSSGSPAQTAAGAADDAKKLRACEACRGLKVRCEPDPREGEPCRRCRKAGRGCVVTAPTRKRQRKTDSRVSELERKIDALTASLQARTGGEVSTRQAASSSASKGQEHRSWDSEVAPWDSARPADQDSHFQQLITMAGRKRKAMDEGNPPAAEAESGGGRPAAEESAAPADDRKPSAAAAAVGWPAYTSRATDGDVVDRGLVPPPLATRLFARYKSQMVRHLPGVVFPPSATVSELRAARPTLFLAVMAAAAGEDHALQRVLQRELMRTLARRVMEVGEKSLELVQALNVAVIWYWPPEHFEELKFYQLIHTAAVMAIDIGLGRRKPSGRASSMPQQAGYHPAWRGRAAPPDPMSVEARRTWLTCYYLASNTAMSLRRPNLVRWTAFMADSVRVLETSPEAAPTDAYLCHLVWTHRLGEQVGAQLSLDDPDAAAAVDIADARTQYALRALERDLERYRAGVPPERMQATLKIGFDLLNLYMHETVLHADGGGDGEDDGLVRDAARPLSAQHVNALTACLAAINGIFTTFLALDVDSIRCLPVFNFVRVAYAVVVLMKMHFSVTAAADSDLAVVFPRDGLRVRQHLDALLDKFRETAAGDRCRPASKFLVVLAMLRSWFVKQDGGGGEAADQQRQKQQSQQQQQQQQQQQRYQQQPPTTANTPLELLSEVAVSSDPSNPASASSPFGYYRPTPAAPPPQQQQSFFNDSNPAATSSGGGGTTAFTSAGAFPPWIAEAMMPDNSGSGGGFDTGAEFPTAMGMGAIQGMGFGFDVGGGGGMPGMNAASNDQFWTDMFQGIPDPNMFTF